MRGHLLILTFGIALLFHGGYSSRLKKGIYLSHDVPAPVRNIRQLAERMGVASYEEFSASVGDSDELMDFVPTEQQQQQRKGRTLHSTSNVAPRAAVIQPPVLGTSDNAPNSANGEEEDDGDDYQGVMGKPGIDFPVLTRIPKTKFSCRNVKTGYYADLDTDCQVFHICDNGRKISFLCPNGTIFRQADLICDWWFKVDCNKSPSLYEQSADHLANDQAKSMTSRKMSVSSSVRKTVSVIRNSTPVNRSEYQRSVQNHSERNNVQNKNTQRNNVNNRQYNDNQQVEYGRHTTTQQEKQLYASTVTPQPNTQFLNRLGNEQRVVTNPNQQRKISNNQQIFVDDSISSETDESYQRFLQKTGQVHPPKNQQRQNGNNNRQQPIITTHRPVLNNNNQNQRTGKPLNKEQQFIEKSEQYFNTNPTLPKPQSAVVVNPQTQKTDRTSQRITTSSSTNKQTSKSSNQNRGSIKSFNNDKTIATNTRTSSNRSQNGKESSNNRGPTVKTSQRQTNKVSVSSSNNQTSRVSSNKAQKVHQKPAQIDIALKPISTTEAPIPIAKISPNKSIIPTQRKSVTTEAYFYDPYASINAQNAKKESVQSKQASFDNSQESQLPAETASFTSNRNNEREKLFQQNTFSTVENKSTKKYTEFPTLIDYTMMDIFGLELKPKNANENKKATDTELAGFASSISAHQYTNPITGFTNTFQPRTTTPSYTSHTRYEISNSYSTVKQTPGPTPPSFGPTIVTPSTISYSKNSFNVNSIRNDERTTLPPSPVHGHFVTYTFGTNTFAPPTEKAVLPNFDTYETVQNLNKDSLNRDIQNIFDVPVKTTFNIRDGKSISDDKNQTEGQLTSNIFDEPSKTPDTETTLAPEDTITLTPEAPYEARSTPKVPFNYPENRSAKNEKSFFSVQELSITTPKPIRYSPSVTKYSPTVPTVTPRPSTFPTTLIQKIYPSTTETPISSYPTVKSPDVSVNAIQMLHTLEDLENKIERKGKKDYEYSGSEPARPGLKVPPSSSPDTLHSLAVYFANAVDNATNNQNNDTELNSRLQDTFTNEDNASDIESALLTDSTKEGYNRLFNNTSNSVPSTLIELENKFSKEINDNDLEIQQSQGPVAQNDINETNIRKLARVFTHALSEYLRDPDMFRKALSEIRPSEPSLIPETTDTPSTDFPTTLFTDHPSITKEEGEVLDFSDVVKTTPRKNLFGYKTTTPYTPYVTPSTEGIPPLTPEIVSKPLSADFELKPVVNYIPDVNPIALNLNSELSPPSSLEETIEELSAEDDDYFPQDDTGARKLDTVTPTPYGFGVKPKNSKPIRLENFKPRFGPAPIKPKPTASAQKPLITLPLRPSPSLIPPKLNLPKDEDIDKISSDVLNYFVPEDLNNLAVIRVNEEYISQDQLQRGKKLNFTKNEEQLQVAYSQSFVSSRNNIERGGKNIGSSAKDQNLSQDKEISIDTRFSKPENNSFQIIVTTDPSNVETTTFSYTESTTEDTVSTTTAFTESTTSTPSSAEDFYSTTKNYDETTTLHSTTESNEIELSTLGQILVPPNHWTRSPIVTKFLQSTLTEEAEVINKELSGSVTGKVNTYLPRDSTSEIPSTSTEDSRSTTTDNVLSTTTELFSYTHQITTEPTTTEIYTTTTDNPVNESFLLAETVSGYDSRRFKSLNLISEPQKITLPFAEILNTSEIQMKSAKQIFGSLNSTSQDILMEKMKHADSNRSVRRLILLLINTCDLDHNKTLEEARKAILNALLNTPTDEDEVETYRTNTFQNKEELTSTTLRSSVQTTTPISTTSTKSPQVYRQVSYSQPFEPSYKDSSDLSLIGKTESDSDGRALELLKSLYGLAAKWGKR